MHRAGFKATMSSSLQVVWLVGTILAGSTLTMDFGARPPEGMPYVPDSIKRSPNETQPSSIYLSQQMPNETRGVGEKVLLTCDIIGSPRPEYKWFWNGIEITKSHSRYSARTVHYGAVLKIDSVTLSDTGEFTCVGYNAAGERNTSARLIVVPQRQRKRKRKKNKQQKLPDGSGGDEADGDDYDYEDLPPSGPLQSPVRGYCQDFRSTVCKTFLDRKQVFVTSPTFQYSMEKRLTRLLEKMVERKELTESCLKLLLEAICYYNFPLCSADKPRHLCQNDCVRVTGDIRCLSSLYSLRTSLAYLQNVGAASMDKDASLDLLSLLPDCGTLAGPGDTQCVSLGGPVVSIHSPTQQPPPPPPPPPPQLPHPRAPPETPPKSQGESAASAASSLNPKQPVSPDCYNGTGRDYNGPMDRGGLSGRPCLAWSSQPGFGHIAGTTCKNPADDSETGDVGGTVGQFNTPWCFVADGTREACAVPPCRNGGSGLGAGIGVGGAGAGVTELSPMSTREMLPVFVSLGVLAFLALGILLICCFCRRASPSSGASGYQGMIKAVGMATAQVHLHQQQQQQQQLLLRQSQRHLAAEPHQQTQPPSSSKGLMTSAKAKEFSLSQIRFGEEIGESAFGRVYKGELIGLYSETSLTPVIIKCLNANADARTQTEFQRDTQSKSELRHPNLVCLLGAALRQSPLAQVHEAVPGGDLHEFLIYRSPQAPAGLLASHRPLKTDSSGAAADASLSQRDMLHIASQVAAGLDYLASRGLVHRDIAARNVLMGEAMLCKLGDLGAARELYNCDYYRLQDRCALPIRWLPPEAILYGQFSPQSDVHSFGVLLWEIWSFGLRPYYGYSNSEVIELVRQRQLLPSPQDCPQAVSGLMLDCWSEIPTRRPTAAAVHERLRQWLAAESDLAQSQQHHHHHHHHHHHILQAAGVTTSQQRVAPVPVPPPPSSMPPPPLPPPMRSNSLSSSSSTGSSDSSSSSDSESSPNRRQAAHRRRLVGALAADASGASAFNMLPAQAV